MRLAELPENGFPIYIVDDDAGVRDGLRFMLEARGWDSHAFACGPSFLGAVAELRPGVVLLDVRMPDVDGLAVLQRLKTGGSRWPVIMMSGHGEAGLAVDSLQGGAIDFLQKPFEEELLDRALDASARALARDTRPAV